MKNVYITGAAGALGSAIKSVFLGNGFHVVGFDRERGEPEEHFAGFAADATDEQSMKQAIELAANRFGPPDVLICTVGGIKTSPSIREASLSEAEFLLRLNYLSAVIAVKAALPLMEGGGSIVTMGAEAALEASPQKAAYGASKAALINFTLALADEGRPLGISANAIVPGVLRTSANLEWGNEAASRDWTAPESVGELCLFLTTPAGRAITGSLLRMPTMKQVR